MLPCYIDIITHNKGDTIMRQTKKEKAIEIIKSSRTDQRKIMVLGWLGYELDDIIELALETEQKIDCCA